MKDQIITLTKQLMQIPYVSGSDEVEKAVELLGLIKEQLSDYPCMSFASNGIPSLLFSNQKNVMQKFKIILNAHVDVIAANENEYIPRGKNGKLFGRGTKDMKAAAAVMILLFKKLAQRVPYSLGLQIVTDEETGGINGTKHQLDCGIRAEFAITGEGSNFRIINEAKTRLVIKLIAEGKASHSAYPWLGDNAIVKLQQVIHAILEKYPLPKNESERTIVNITGINTTNTVWNRTPQQSEAILDIRYTHEDSSILMFITSLLPEGVKLEVLTHWPTHYTNPENSYIKILLYEAEKILHTPVSLARAFGSSDMPFYTEVGCASIEFGPIGGNHHAENEWVDIQSLQDYYRILEKFLLILAQTNKEKSLFRKAYPIQQEIDATFLKDDELR